MPSCLLLALVLLGTTSARHLGFVNLPRAEAEHRAVECPLANETRLFSLTDPESGATCSYAVVPHQQTFSNAQHVCSQCYGGQLASIHDAHTNSEMQFWGGLALQTAELWIGGVIQSQQGNSVNCHWSDNSAWNYQHWQQGYPRPSGQSCTTFCIDDGFWRNIGCGQPMPFVCEF